MNEMPAINPSIRSILLLLTNRCNLQCRHCYVSSHPGGARGLSLSRVLRLVEEAREELGRIQFILTGGEPLARAADALQILERASEHHAVLLLTNGTLISQDIARRLASLDVTVRISLDGAGAPAHEQMRGAGSFAAAMRGIGRLKEAGFPDERLELFSTIVPENLHDIDAILALARGLGVQRMKFEPVAKTGRAREFWPVTSQDVPDPDTAEYRQFFSAQFHERHGAEWAAVEILDRSFDTLTIYSDGRAYPFTYMNERDEVIGYLGNVNERSLKEILDPDALSRAIVGKFLMFARGPSRSLRALRVFRPECGPDAPGMRGC